MAKTDNIIDFLGDVADAIREKKETTEPIAAQDFADEIKSIETDGMRYFDCRNMTSDGYVYSSSNGGISNAVFIAKCFSDSKEIFILPGGNYVLAIGLDPDVQCYSSGSHMTMRETINEFLNYEFSCTLEDLPEITKEEFYDLTWEVPNVQVS